MFGIIIIILSIVLASLLGIKSNKPTDSTTELSETIIETTTSYIITEQTIQEQLENTLYGYENIVISETDIEMIAYTLAHEVLYMDYTYKVATAEIIRNQILDDRFPNNVYDVLHNGYNDNTLGNEVFGAIENYYTQEFVPDEEIYDAINEVFFSESNLINGAVAYRNPEWSSEASDAWFDTLEIVYVYTQEMYNGEYSYNVTTEFYKIP